MAAPEYTPESCLLSLRSPSVDCAELAVTRRGRCHVYRLTFSQVKLIAAQTAQAVLNWPVQELPPRSGDD